MKKRAWPPIARNVSIVKPKLSKMSGTYGAAVMVFNDIYLEQNNELTDLY